MLFCFFSSDYKGGAEASLWTDRPSTLVYFNRVAGITDTFCCGPQVKEKGSSRAKDKVEPVKSQSQKANASAAEKVSEPPRSWFQTFRVRIEGGEKIEKALSQLLIDRYCSFLVLHCSSRVLLRSAVQVPTLMSLFAQGCCLFGYPLSGPAAGPRSIGFRSRRIAFLALWRNKQLCCFDLGS